jgi:hypothetical protein
MPHNEPMLSLVTVGYRQPEKVASFSFPGVGVAYMGIEDRP